MVLRVEPTQWRGRPGRLEVWYTTLTDPASGTGVWLHHELVAPVSGDPYTHGWVAVFPPDGPPVYSRFGPHPYSDGLFTAGDVLMAPHRLTGRAGEVTWNLRCTPGGEPLYTFPKWAWRHHLLPAAQMVPAPASTFDGTLTWGDSVLDLTGAPGASARIYGDGNARRWAWLHADLGGGDVLEVVAAVSQRPLFRLLPPLTFLRLRVGGREYPRRDPLLASFGYKADLTFPAWSVVGRGLRVDVTLPEHNTLALNYTNPDGSTAVCRNSERASCVLTVGDRRWQLDGTAHAEVGIS